MKVGDKLKIEIEMECVFAPGCGTGKIYMRVAGNHAEVTDSDTGEQLGRIGGAIGGVFNATLCVDGGLLDLACDVEEQWRAVTVALKEQYGIEPGCAASVEKDGA